MITCVDPAQALALDAVCIDELLGQRVAEYLTCQESIGQQ
jgi:hypothetical protein